MSDLYPGIQFGTMGIGTRAWGAKRMWGYGNEFFDEDLKQVFITATKSGVRLFDTAEIYGGGQSEELLGKFNKVVGADIIVASKYAPFPWRFSRNSFKNALRNSLKRLKLKQVDLYQIHWPWPLASIESLMESLADAVEGGLVKAVGVSNYNISQMVRAHKALTKLGIPLTSNQIKFNLLHTAPDETGLLDKCRELGIAVIAYNPIGEGMLTGKYSPDKPPIGPRRRRYNKEYLEKIKPLNRLLYEIGKAHGNKTPVQVALNWIIVKGAIPIPGTKNAQQAEENIGAMGWQLDEAEADALDVESKRVT
jgi:aryl-alcohol dehydrogenase-like predicted oxidoreductase